MYVQSKFSYVPNQLPVTAFQKAWNIFYNKFGHPYKIARCCEERLKIVHKIPNDDKNTSYKVFITPVSLLFGHNS